MLPLTLRPAGLPYVDVRCDNCVLSRRRRGVVCTRGLHARSRYHPNIIQISSMPSHGDPTTGAASFVAS